jgi:glycosyltransferase involved in cell wall biosynthesis
MLQFGMIALETESRSRRARAAISFFLPNLCLGGAEKVTVHLANGLAARGYCVDMVLFTAEGEFLSELSPAIRLVDLKARRMVWAISRFAKYLRTERPAVVISALDYVNVGAILARRISRTFVPLVMTIHSTRSMAVHYKVGIREDFLRLLGQWCYRRSRNIICVSQGVADDLAETTGTERHRLRVVYNPVVSQRTLEMSRQPVDHPWLAPGAPPVILAVGRLTAVKDYPTLIRAFAAIRDQREMRLMILGEGEERPQLERLVAELGLADCVALPGYGANPYNYMARAAVFVLSSISEALPTALIEALAVGTPVVATDCKSGPKEILHGGRYGALVPVGDVTALGGAIVATLQGARREVPAEVVQPYTMDYAIDEYCRIITEVTNG